MTEEKISISASPITEADMLSGNMDDVKASLADILGGNEPIPEFLEIDEAILIRAFIPDDRLPELEAVCKQFAGSLTGDKPINHFGWVELYFLSPANTFESKLGLLMATLTAKDWLDWQITLNIVRDTNPALKKLAVLKMIAHAKLPKERTAARIEAKKLGIEIPEEK